MNKADLIVTNGHVLSVGLDGQITRGEAVAVKGEKIIAVGNMEDIIPLAGEETQIIDCGGNTVLPGLCDAHCHPSIAASAYTGCDLFGIYIQEGETPDEIIDRYMRRLRDYIESNPGTGLVRGTGWVMGNFSGERMPTRHDIDKVCSDRPVILESFCQHNLWVNSKAIEIAGVSEETSDVYTGEILREKDGFPSGIFRDPEAMDLIKKNVPGYDYSIEEYKEAFLYYQKELANRYGVTLVQDCLHSDNAREAYVQLAKEGKLTLRARGVYLLEPSDFKNQLEGYIERKGRDNVDKDFRVDTIKIFVEGEFSLMEPYEPEFTREAGLPEGYNGPLYWTDDDLISGASRAMKAGYGVHIHAMGDKAVRQSVCCLAKAQRESGRQNRSVIAHLMLTGDEEAEIMGRENIIANCQPRWMVYDSDIQGMTPMMGEDRAQSAYPLRKFLDQGVTVSFGTDFPVTPPPDTMHEIQCAMTRRVFPDAPDYDSFRGKVLGTEKPAELKEAIQALSINGAYQMSMEDLTGSIEVGKSAELVILDQNIESVPADEIYNIKIEATIFKGKIVYQKDKDKI